MIKRNLSKKAMSYIYQEIFIMQQTCHENVLRYIDAKRTKKSIYIFLEYCNGGDLRRLFDLKCGKLDEGFSKIILKQIAEGLSYLNSKNVMHRDLKLENILLNFPDYTGEGQVPDEYIENFDYKKKDRIEVIIGDLGFARTVDENKLVQSYLGTPLNMAPEIMNGESYSTKVDIWSFGTIMYELLVGFTPFTGYDPNDLAKNGTSEVTECQNNIKLSLNCLDLLNRCLQYDFQKRISHKDLLEHPFLVQEGSSEEISLSCSVGPGQMSFFDNPPESFFEINNDNAIIINTRDSILFNNIYQKTLEKFNRKKQENVKTQEEAKEEAAVRTREDEEDKDQIDSQPTDLEDSEDDENEVPEDLDFTIIDLEKELKKGPRLDTINEDEEDGLGDSSVSSEHPRRSKKDKEDREDENQLESSFELNHYHDIKILNASYLI
eukprot:CAMPEP_0168333920 /NCGR_PEP_ID=MMETSP0213-20121227/9921_1 /TAXON_ID=151035 /ORGANISM="Euplotes harpa, Strain FSP1.4" /LENGTH=434 /DNA_ID=CAMNT_0008338389 /DNA_START=147 /DNA_END=1452 /DNA_ORIENTATION=+